jgi:hypothetical protein
MCFSANASFTAGTVLSVIGALSVRKVTVPSQNFFAVIPILFAIQQFAEGFLWLSLTTSEFAELRESMTFLFLFFAQVLWPAWVPFAVMKMNPSHKVNPFGKVLLLCGILVSVYLGYCLLNYPVSAVVDGMHISYEQQYPQSVALICGILYIVATVFPPFFSGMKRMWSLGFAILISYVITTVFYNDYLVSVWCFFASVISIAVYSVVHALNDNNGRVVPAKV